MQIGQDSSIKYWVEYMVSSVISFSYFTYFSNPSAVQIFANGKQCFYFFLEVYVMQLKDQGVEF